MKVFYHDLFTFPLPDGHRFPVDKYARLRERVVAEGVIPLENLLIPAPATDEQLALAHTPEYVHKVANGELTGREIRRIGFPWSPELVERSRRSVGSTIAACRAALQDGVAFNLAGGTHHACADRGAGFCVFNDAAVAARVVQAEGLTSRVLILDCDVHQGDGTARILAGDRTIFTFSIHCARNYPFRKEVSDLDVPLEDGTGDEDYLQALEAGLETALGRAQAELVIYLAGADPFEGDKLGRLALSKRGLAARDRFVLDRCFSAGLPVAVAMAGGYAHKIDDIADIHLKTVQIASEFSNQVQLTQRSATK